MALITSKSRVKPKFSVGKRQEEAEKSRQDELDELCVVGYACKLFRDDARAREVDRGSLLIPWMGDETLKIDRYDGRGHLHDLREFDEVGWNEDSHLSAEAARIEALCDEERYMALHKDLLEEQHRQEEELKRLNEAITSDRVFSSVEFGYGAGNEDYDPMQPTEDETEAAQKKLESLENQPPPSYRNEKATPAADVEEPFIAPPELKLPPGMGQPETLKMHLFMEKTAMFVSNQGVQMEIIVKTKQANNPQFDFLQFDHFLNPYYKHIVAAIKSKMYIPLVLRASEPDKKKQGEIGSRRSSNSNSVQSDDEDDELEGSGYLHPSLFAPPRPKPAAVQVQHHLPTGAVLPDNIPPPLQPHHQTHREMFHHPGSREMMDPQQQLMAYYEGEPVTTTTTPAPYHHLPHPMLAPPPPPPDHANSGAPPVQLSHPMGGPLAPPPPGYHLPSADPSLPPGGPVLPHHHHPAMVQQPMHDTQLPLPPHSAPATMLGPPLISQDMHIPPAADESAIEPQPAPIVPPPPDIQPVIDKLAKYVAKNGDEFEASVRAKCDPRFEFLVPWHSYNAYYLAKKQMFIQELNQGAAMGDSGGDGRNAAERAKKVPVRFPIKPKKAEERTLERKSALPVESSSDSNDDDEDAQNQSTSSNKNQQRVNKLSASDAALAIQSRAQQPGRAERTAVQIPRGAWITPGVERPVQYGERNAPSTDYDDGGGVDQYGGVDTQGRGGMMGDDAVAYGYHDYEDDDGDDRGIVDDGREPSRAPSTQPRLEDRLALAARKKLASASQERTLQVERRKKLALFLSQVKDRPQAAAAAQEGAMSDPEREIGTRDEVERSRSSSRPRSPMRSNRVERGASPPSRVSHSESRGSKKAPSVPRSYQKAVNREALERDRRRKRHSRSRSPSPRKQKRKSPPPIAAIGAGSTAIIGRSSSASPLPIDMFQERDSPVSSTSSDCSYKMGGQTFTQPGGSEAKSEAKGGASDLRAKIRAMLAATRKEDVG